MKQDIIDRLYNNLLIVENGCWEWQRGKIGMGYGHISYRGNKLLTHRLMWELHNGTIPYKMCICHHCDNPPCCNPDHLYLGTYKDNNIDTVIKGHHINGHAKLTENDVREIRRLLSIKLYTQQQIADMFNISKPVINHINCGRNWTGVI